MRTTVKGRWSLNLGSTRNEKLNLENFTQHNFDLSKIYIQKQFEISFRLIEDVITSWERLGIVISTL